LPSAKALLFGVLAALGAAFIGIWARQPRPAGARVRPTAKQIAIGFVTNFFDTLGIGSFATTTALYRFLGQVPDGLIPGTLLIGHTFATLAEAFIFIGAIKVDMTTLVLLIVAAMVGAWLGAGVVSRWPRQRIQRGMGALLIVAAGIMAARAAGLWPGGGEALGLTGARLGVAIAGNMLLGALMTLGIGLFAPCMIMLALLVMNETAAFPIMMGSCAFLMPGASVRFVRSGRYDLSAAVGLTLGGIPAVVIAGLWIKSLRLTTVKWLVVVVVVYTGLAMLRSAVREGKMANG